MIIEYKNREDSITFVKHDDINAYDFMDVLEVLAKAIYHPDNIDDWIYERAKEIIQEYNEKNENDKRD